MGWWDDVSDFVSDVGEAVGDAVEDVVNEVGDAVADVVETVGNGIQDGLNAVGGWLGGIPGIGGFLQGAFEWLGGIVAGAFNFVAAVVKGVFGIVGGVLGGLIKIIAGILALNGSLILEGLIDIGSSIAGALISVVGTFISLGERIIPFINEDRALTDDEKALLKQVFRGSLSLYNIRLKSNHGIGGTFTLNNTIYTNVANLMLPLHTLVHECVHIWQYQNLGTRYLSDAIGAQLIYGRDPKKPCKGNAYDWQEELNRGTTKWEDFNMESAAQLINEIWTDGTITIKEVGTTVQTVETGSGAFYKKPLDPEDLHFELEEEFIADDTPDVPDPLDPTQNIRLHCPRDGMDYTRLAIEAVKTMRGAWNWRVSQFI